MKMIYVATLATEPDRDSFWVREFGALGWGVISLSTLGVHTLPGVAGKLKRRFGVGRENTELQEKLIDLVDRTKPAWVHFRLPIEFGPATIRKIRQRQIVVTEYFNDDPFSPKAPLGIHWKFRRAIPAYDGHFVFRRHNLESFRRAGADFVEHCPPFFDPERQTPACRRADAPFLADAAFIGHWEDDWRTDCLEALHQAGFSIILKGGRWDQAIRGRALAGLAPISHAFGADYNRIYANVVAGLCFFSKINGDTWTRRAMEIIAVGGLLVCERTQEAAGYFTDREEAFFFSSIDELITVLTQLKADPARREQVRAAGYRKLMDGTHTIRDRAAQIDRFVRRRLDGAARHGNS